MRRNLRLRGAEHTYVSLENLAQRAESLLNIQERWLQQIVIINAEPLRRRCSRRNSNTRKRQVMNLEKSTAVKKLATFELFIIGRKSNTMRRPAQVELVRRLLLAKSRNLNEPHHCRIRVWLFRSQGNHFNGLNSILPREHRPRAQNFENLPGCKPEKFVRTGNKHFLDCRTTKREITPRSQQYR